MTVSRTALGDPPVHWFGSCTAEPVTCAVELHGALATQYNCVARILFGVAGEARLASTTVACVLAFLVGASAEEAGLRTLELPFETYGRPIVREDFERCEPAHIIKARDDVTKEQKWLADGPAEDRAEGYWVLRHPGWTNTLINVSGTPSDLTYDPQLRGPHDIYLGLRAVDPYMSLGAKLSDEEEFSIITSPAATPETHYDFEFHWRIGADLTGKQIIFRSVGRAIYLQHIRFVPLMSGTRRERVATDHVTSVRARKF